MTTFQLGSSAAMAIDGPAASIDSVTFIRRGAHVYAQVDAMNAEAFVRALAYTGIAAEACEPITLPSPTRSPTRIHAIGTRLDPLPPAAIDMDLVRLARLDMGASTREALRRWMPWLRAPSKKATDICRRLLRGDEVLFAWERRTWLGPTSLRDPRVRRCVHPVVFGSHATERLRGRCAMTSGELARWAS